MYETYINNQDYSNFITALQKKSQLRFNQVNNKKKSLSETQTTGENISQFLVTGVGMRRDLLDKISSDAFIEKVENDLGDHKHSNLTQVSGDMLSFYEHYDKNDERVKITSNQCRVTN